MTEKTIHLVTIKRYAEINNIDRTTVQRWVREGKIQRYYPTDSKKGYLNPSERPEAS